MTTRIGNVRNKEAIKGQLMADNVTWTLSGGRVLGPAPFFVVGIVNCTPDSFYDGGLYFDSEAGVNHALSLYEQGADVVDIGGESTRPFPNVFPSRRNSDACSRC